MVRPDDNCQLLASSVGVYHGNYSSSSRKSVVNLNGLAYYRRCFVQADNTC